MAAVEGLSDREKQVLEHLQQAQNLGVSIREYADAYSVDVKDLYNGKAQLVRKGVLPGKVEGATGFVPVQIAAAPGGGSGSCRITHPSGWTIECSELPDAQWIAQLLQPATSS